MSGFPCDPYIVITRPIGSTHCSRATAYQDGHEIVVVSLNGSEWFRTTDWKNCEMFNGGGYSTGFFRKADAEQQTAARVQGQVA